MGAVGMPRSTLLSDPWDFFERPAAPMAATRRASGWPPAASRLAVLEAVEDPEGYTLTAEVPGGVRQEGHQGASVDEAS